VSTGDCSFELVDTGGLGFRDPDRLTGKIEQQIEAAIRDAQLILFVLDVRTGAMPLDEEVAKKLHASGKRILAVANKSDTSDQDLQASELARLGFGVPLCVSAHHRRGFDELLEQIGTHLPPVPPPSEDTTELKLAIVGRRNTGKSTFINQLAQSERVIVSEVPGTTRDSIDVRFERDGKSIVAIDTAGVRRKRSVKGDIEFYSLARAERSIRRADVVLLFFDARHKVSMVDKKLSEYILENHKPTVFVVNKWDLMKPLATGEFGDYLRKVFPSLDFVPIAFITAKDGKNVYKVVNLAQNLYKQAAGRVGTGDLNRVIGQAVTAQPPPLRMNRTPKIYYATQVAAFPPTIVLFTNGPELLDRTYRRYLLKWLREALPFADVPIKLLVRSRQREDRAKSETEKKPVRKKKNRRTPTEPELWKDV
jgi:GTP-binding protein